jgi:DUF1680 family protein
MLTAAAATPLTGRVAAAGPQAFPLRNVRILRGPFREAQQRGLSYLLSLDPDRLLHTFRLNAGLPTSATPLGGWEAPGVELRGHSLGHYLSACALMTEATGDERLRQRALAVVAELRKVRLALASRGSHAGYLSAFPEEFFDRLEARQGVWAPYYTLHKIMAGLRDVHRVTGDPEALEILRGMARWVGYRASRLDDAAWQALLETEFGGMEEVLSDLYVTTGDAEHLRLARLFDHRVLFDVLATGADPLDGLHANTQIPKAIGAARDCALTRAARYCAVADALWKHVALERSYVIGGHSEYEYFSPLVHFSRHLGVKTAETCNTYNMLKLTWQLFEHDGDPSRLDFYARALFNHILASQDPRTGMVSYHLALSPGAWRTYATRNDSFWCCVGTGMENPARYGDAIYAHQGAAVLVSLFVDSELTWPEMGLTLRQETRFPDEGRTRLTLRLNRPERFALRVRHPAWAKTVTATVNGEAPKRDSRPASFVSVEREWHDGDAVDVLLPMSLHAEAMPDDPSVVALLYGPIVLAADLGNAGLDDATRYGMTAPEMVLEDTPPAPVLVAANVGEALARIRPTADPLMFRSEGLGRPQDVELRPFFRLTDRRYAVYFPVMSQAALAACAGLAETKSQARAELDRRTVDRVQPGVTTDEEKHQLAQRGSAAVASKAGSRAVSSGETASSPTCSSCRPPARLRCALNAGVASRGATVLKCSQRER